MIVPEKAVKNKALNYKRDNMANDIWEDAKSYFCATMILENQRKENELFSPIVMNAAFACELYSKAILCKYKCEMPIKKHGLKSLYDRFPTSVHKLIRDTYNGGTIKKFEKWIDDIDDIFEFWRYRYEHEKYSVHYGFVLEYMKILNNVTEKIMEM